MESLTIEQLDAAGAEAAIPDLCRVLSDCVEGGASVGFLSPLAPEKAEAFWAGVAADVGRGAKLLFVARRGGEVVGTAQVVFAGMENQPHRAEVSKVLVCRAARRRGVGEGLMRAAEAAALAAGRTLLVLDTATPDAERLYRRMGWQEAGVIPDYALFPDGRLCDTTFFWKRLGAVPN